MSYKTILEMLVLAFVLTTSLTSYRVSQYKKKYQDQLTQNKEIIIQLDSLRRTANDLGFQLNYDDSDYFTPSMFDSKDAPGSGKHMKKKFLEMLTEFRMYLGEDIYVNSAFRTKKHNHKIGGAEHSQHMNGMAIDIACKSQEDRYAIIQSAILAGFNRIGIGKTFIHLDCANEEDFRVWLY